MHTYSANVLKTKNKIAPTNHKPREGTKTRELYDLFCTSKGKPVSFCATNTADVARIAQLTDVYGLDIRRLKKNTWCLVGEWFGKVYIDYLAEQVSEIRHNVNSP